MGGGGTDKSENDHEKQGKKETLRRKCKVHSLEKENSASNGQSTKQTERETCDKREHEKEIGVKNYRK